jgi:nucleotide-binding universal stress UspA family protein
MVQQFQKGAEMMVHTQVLMAAEIVRLRAANKAASERKTRTKKQIQHRGTLSQQEAEEIIERRDADALVKAERHEERVRTGGGGQGSQRCGRCSEAGHNKRTCKKDAAELGN